MPNFISLSPIDHYYGKPINPAITSPSELRDKIASYFGHYRGNITVQGRAAITALLEHLGLKREDEVWIMTTFNFPNVSSHVTATIFNICKPSRVLTENTRAIFVIHEFGIPHPEILNLKKIAKKRGIPLIEDCAHTLSSYNKDYRVGTVGDYVIISFPKIFPVKWGGALLGEEVDYFPSPIDEGCIIECCPLVYEMWDSLEDIAEARRAVFRKLTEGVKGIGLAPLFEVSDSISPWFFPLPTPQWQELIVASMERGVECTQWYGREMVILPCHQYLGDYEIARIIESIKICHI